MTLEDVLPILACPKCHNDLVLHNTSQTMSQNNAQGDKALGDQALLCASCGVLYPIRNDIPILLISEAVPVGSSEQSDTSSHA